MSHDRPQVLLVDGTDEADRVVRLLAEAEYEPIHVTSTIEAENRCITTLLDAVVVGLETAGALAFCDLVRTIPRCGGIPLIVLDNPQKPSHSAREVLGRDVDVFLSRAEVRDELLGQLSSVLGRHEVREPTEESLLEPAAPGTAEPEDAGGSEPRAEQDDRGGVAADDGSRTGGDRTSEQMVAPEGPRREPTQVLEDPAATSESDGVSWADMVAEGVFSFGAARREEPDSVPWEQELPGPGDEDLSELDVLDDELPVSSVKGDTDLPTLERPLGPPREETEADDDTLGSTDVPWSLPESLASIRPERTQILTGDGRLTPASVRRDSGEPPREGRPETALSPEFRRVIDEVAQRLFPESAPDDGGDEQFGEVHTVVPSPEAESPYDLDDLDDFSFDAMETFASGHVGLTLSDLDMVPTADDEPATRDTKDDGRTGDHPTQQRSTEHPTRESGHLPLSPPPIRSVEPRAEVGTPATGALTALPTTEREPPTTFVIDDQPVDSGDLQRYPFPVLLAACLVHGVRARIVLRLHEAEAPPPAEGFASRTVVFDGGRVLAASSSLRSDRLIEMLRRQGKLSGESYARCRALIESTGRRAGAVLVHLGVIKTGELLPLVRWHYEELIFGCFDWRRGTFRLEPLPPTPSWRVTLDRGGPELLLEGLRRRYGPKELEELIGGPRVVLRLRSDPVSRLPPGALLEGEEAVIDRCDGRRTAARVAEASPVDRGQALAVLYGLLLLGYLEPEAGAPERAHLDRVVDRGRLEQRLALAREADYFSLLGLAPEASPYEIRRAYEAVRRELSPEGLAEIDATDLADRIDEARYALDEAYEVLSDAELRETYRRGRFGEDPLRQT